mmetsp:Transcript_4263/g.6957  ORF Transcript_4263/g.6957 Transcript_4263/m.6957 type:complete len:80 (-) Transcript_4263:103-342(-)
MQMLQIAVAASILAGRLVVGQQWPSWVPSQARDMFGELDDVAGTSKDAAFGGGSSAFIRICPRCRCFRLQWPPAFWLDG